MTAFPKPPHRGPKPRKRIARSAPPKRTSRPRQQRKGEQAAQRRECWRLLSLIVRIEQPLCQSCIQRTRVRPSTEAAHIFSRRYESTRYTRLNIVALCHVCHVELGDVKLSNPGSPMERFARALLGDAQFEHLAARASTPAKFHPATLDILRSRAVALGIKVKAIPASDIPH